MGGDLVIQAGMVFELEPNACKGKQRTNIGGTVIVRQDGESGPGYSFIDETDNGLGFDRAGLLAMANSGPSTNGSQFFITYAPTAQYDGKFTIFGQVLNGMDVLKSLTSRDAQPGTNTPPGDKLLSVTIEEK